MSEGKDNYDCRQVFERLDDYVDRALSADEEQQIREHLDCCEPCAGVFDFEESVVADLKAKLRRIRAPADLKSRISRLLEGV